MLTVLRYLVCDGKREKSDRRTNRSQDSVVLKPNTESNALLPSRATCWPGRRNTAILTRVDVLSCHLKFEMKRVALMLELTLEEVKFTMADDAETEDRSDAVLLKRLKKGDRAAFDELFRRYERQLLGYLINMFSDIEFARDICQDAFLKLLKRPPLFLAGADLKPWLFRVARNLAFDQLKRNRRQSALDDIQIPPSEGTPADDYQLRDDIADLRRCLQQLTPELREVVSMRIYGNLTFREISETTKIPLGTALWRMQRAIKELRQRIGEVPHV